MPKKIKDQVIVITGASSGIGRIAARKFGEQGARVVASARNEDALESLVQEIEQADGQAVAVRADVSKQQDVQHLADIAVERFGRIDTWVNNAGVSIYATFDKLTDQEIRRIMDVNFMGTVYGIQAAHRVMREHGGGTIVNIASVTGKRAIPLQSIYSASKYAIVGLGEALRAELANENVEINICTICPLSINTPFFEHARSKEGLAPKPKPPVYEPDVVADAILDCAVHPRREILIGSAGKAFAALSTLVPGLMDWYMSKAGINAQLSDEPKSDSAPANLFEPSHSPREQANWTTWGRKSQALRRTDGGTRRYSFIMSAAGALALAFVARRIWK